VLPQPRLVASPQVQQWQPPSPLVVVVVRPPTAHHLRIYLSKREPKISQIEAISVDSRPSLAHHTTRAHATMLRGAAGPVRRTVCCRLGYAPCVVSQTPRASFSSSPSCETPQPSLSLEPQYLFVYGTLRPDSVDGAPWTKTFREGMRWKRARVYNGRLFFDLFPFVVLSPPATSAKVVPEVVHQKVTHFFAFISTSLAPRQCG